MRMGLSFTVTKLNFLCHKCVGNNCLLKNWLTFPTCTIQQGSGHVTTLFRDIFIRSTHTSCEVRNNLCLEKITLLNWMASCWRFVIRVTRKGIVQISMCWKSQRQFYGHLLCWEHDCWSLMKKGGQLIFKTKNKKKNSNP